MTMTILNIILVIIAIYLACGFVFAIPFVIRGADKIDEGVHGTTWGFRVIILPASVIFWPLLLKKWISANKNKGND